MATSCAKQRVLVGRGQRHTWPAPEHRALAFASDLRRKGRHDTVGVLYLDTRSSAFDAMNRPEGAGKFTEDHLALAVAIGHQAALAVEETRYHHALVQAERLAAVGQTIAALSHHIKNILQGLRSGSDILRTGLTWGRRPAAQGLEAGRKRPGARSSTWSWHAQLLEGAEPTIEETDLNALVERGLRPPRDPRAGELGHSPGAGWTKRCRRCSWTRKAFIAHC